MTPEVFSLDFIGIRQNTPERLMKLVESVAGCAGRVSISNPHTVFTDFVV